MPSGDTFSIKPVSDLLDRWLGGRGSIIDPFARNSKRAHFTNDLNPDTKAEYNMDAVEYLDMMDAINLRCDAVLIDPPYSPRQISEVYKQVGREVGMEGTQNAKLYRRVKEAADKLLNVGGIAICCGWNSAGMGGKNYRFEEILLVAHGGAHNDTIVTVETKVQATLF